MDIDNIEVGYSKIANKYTETFFNELIYKPLDRYLLKEFCNNIREKGKVCDLGCGPGHISRFVKDQGIDVCGIDLSDGMLKKAKEKNPDIEFTKGNMIDLETKEKSFAGIILYYSIVHFTIKEVEEVFVKLRNVLENYGLLFLAFHVGDEVLHIDSLFNEELKLDYIFFNTDEIVCILKKHKFKIIEAITRYPYDEEYGSKKGYIICQKIVE